MGFIYLWSAYRDSRDPHGSIKIYKKAATFRNITLSSSSFSGIQPSPGFSSSNTSISWNLTRCFNVAIVHHIITAYCITSLFFVMPLYVVILYLVFQRWNQYSPSAPVAASQSEVFTYNMVVMGVVEIFASSLYCVGGFVNKSNLTNFGTMLFYISWSVKLQFHSLICIKCYLAVVHPLMYRGLKSKNGVRIRHICIICVWFFFFSWAVSAPFESDEVRMIIFFCSLAFAFIVICFCNIAVLWVLRRPGPGDVNRDRERVDQTKRRAFMTLLIIMGAVLLTLLWLLVCNALYASPLLENQEKCVIVANIGWFCLPCNVVLPLLYLYRAGKLPRCTHNAE